VRRREPMTPERMVWMRRNGWLPREPAQRDRQPRDALTTTTLTPWLPPTAPDEGTTITFSLDGVSADYAALGDLRDDITAIAHQAHAAGYPISLKQLCSERRYYIASALITLHRACGDRQTADPATMAAELARCLVAHIIDDEAAQQPGIPLGAVVGSLDAAHARIFCSLAEAFEAGQLALMFTGGGRMYLPEDPDQSS